MGVLQIRRGDALVDYLTAGPGSPIGDAAPDFAGFATAPLPGGGYVAAWKNGGAVMAQRYDAAGTKVGAEIIALPAPVSGNVVEDVALAALSDGSFVVTWSKQNTGTGLGAEVYARLYGSDGTSLGGEIAVTTPAAGDQMYSGVVPLSGGGFVITWYSYTVGPRAQIFDSAGAKLGGEFDTFTDPLAQGVPLADGGFALLWHASGAGFDAYVQLYDSAGVTTSGPILVGDSRGYSDIAALPAGGFIVAWSDDDYHVLVQKFDSQGAPVGAEVAVTAPDKLGFDVAVTAQVTGAFTVVWKEQDLPFDAMQARLYSADNIAVGSDVDLSSFGTQMPYPQLITLSEGDFLAAWNGAGGPYQQLLNAPLIGGFGPDLFLGTPGADEYHGLTGDDQIHGAASGDVLHGDEGNDEISGDDGDDALYGGDGDDVLDGGDGDDLLDGGEGNDTVHGGYGNDIATVTGGTTSADTDTEIVDLGYNPHDPQGSNAAEYGSDHLIVDYSSTIENVIFTAPAWGPAGAEAKAQIGGLDRLTYWGVGSLTVTTGSGDDKVYAVGGSDIISTGAGNDEIHDFYSGAIVGHRTHIDGGAGVDVAHSVNWAELTGAVLLDLNNPDGVTIGSGADQRYLRGVESVWGLITGEGDDVITLDSDGALSNLLDTGYGADTVTVYGGATSAATGDVVIDMGWDESDHLIVDFSAATQQVIYLANSSGGGGTAIGGVQHHVYTNTDRVTVTTGSGNDVVDARDEFFSPQVFSTGTGADELYGGLGDDSLDGGADNDLLSGGFGADTLVGGGGDDYLDGGGHADTMTGGAGDDTYVVNQAGDVVVELAGGGFDRVYATGTYALGAGVEIEVLAAGGSNPAAAIGLTGNEGADNIWANDGDNTLAGLGGNDSLFGYGGNDYLDGGTGADFMIGGAGDDIFVVDDALDYALEYGSEGEDRVYALSGFTLNGGSSIEILIAGGPVIAGGRNLTGNELANNVWDDAGDNDMFGAGGNDALFGFAGHDYLDGGTGADFLVGGTGDDTYVVDDGGDIVIEGAGEGSDAVYAMTGFTLNAGSAIEILIAGGPVIAGGRNLTGNELANNVWDDAGDNDLYGGGGNDALFGFAGNDYLDGGTGNDFLVGGSGDDVFVVDSAGDVVVELTGEGSDTVYASADYTLAGGQSIEILAAGGSGAIGLTGNELANNLWGNSGNNALNGADGNDAVFGFGGNDTLSGGAGSDLAVGGAGDDSLSGGDGADTLLGEAGADSFVFDGAFGGGIDTIGDFSAEDDLIALDDAVFAGLAPGALAAGAFVTGIAPADADDRIVYDAVTGALWFDADGNGAGAAIQFATLNGSPVLTAGDFLVI